MTVNSNNNKNQVDIPTLEEAQHIVNKLKCNKVAGSDNIPAELLKYGENAIANNIDKLFYLFGRTRCCLMYGN